MKKLIILMSLLVVSLIASAQDGGKDVNCIYCSGNETGKLSSAIGGKNTSLGEYSLASGLLNSATGNYSFALGKSTFSTGKASFAFGENCQANGDNNISIGISNISDGLGSFSIGIQATSSEIASFSTGSFLENEGAYSMLFGCGYSPTQKLTNNIDHSLSIGFLSTKPTFFVSSSSGGINSTGKIGIGNITDPLAKLHIRADNNEDASLLLQPTGTDYFAKILFDKDAHQIYGKSGEAFKFKSQIGQDFLFENGNIVLEEDKYIATDKISGSLSNKLQLYDNLNGITIANGGNVGIKSGSPEHTLEINGDMLVSLKSTFQKDIEQTAGYSIETSQLKAPDVNGISLTNQNGNGLFVDNMGNVGIGITTPASTLEVDGSFSVADMAVFNGNVGIGTSGIPTEKLEVLGKIKTTQLQITDGTTNTNNHVLISDQNGVASWTDPSFLDDGDWLTNGSGEIFHSNTNVGIGTSNPIAPLEVNGDIVVSSPNKKFVFHSSTNSPKLLIAPVNSTGNGEWANSLVLFNSGYVGIGFTDAAYATARLTVNGNILAKEVKVRSDAGGGADFVFDDNYEIPKLGYIETFVQEHKHLPDIPSAAQMKEEGIDLGDLQIKLLQKIEELTLYVIELKKENEGIIKENKEIKDEIEKLTGE